MGVINKVVVKGVTYDIEDKINKEELLKRLQGTSENSNAMKDPFKFIGSFNTSTIGDFRTWLDNLHGTSSGLDNRGFYRAILNDSVIEITSSPINYTTEEYIQVVRGRVSVASTTGLLTFSYEYNILERKYSATDGWSSWRVVASADKFENLYANAIQIGSFEVESLTDGIGVNFSNIDGTQGDSFDIPAATAKSAGVMSAEDKKEQVKKTPLVNGDIIVGQAREVYSRQGKIDTATFLKRTTAGGTSVSDGVASVKQIGGNIVKNLVDTSFVGNETIGVVNGHIYYFSSCLFNGQSRFADTSTDVYSGWKQHSIISKATSDSITIAIEGDKALNTLLINLTEMYGAGKEPTKEVCDKMFGAMDALSQGLTIAQPTGLKSTGYNQWNPENVLINKAVTDNAIVDGDKNIAVVECLPCKVGAGENNGYVIGYGEGDSWSDDGIEVYLTPLNPMEVEGELYMYKMGKDTDYGTYVPQIKGYLLVVTPTADKLCAHLHWSGDRAKTDYEEYVESNVAIPVIPEMSEWGLAGISASGTLAADTIDLDRMVYTKRIGCFDGGEASWYFDSAYGGWISNITRSVARYGTPFICDRYPYKGIYTAVIDKTIGYIFNTRPFIKDSSYADATAFKASLQGVMFYYELAEPEEYPIVTKTAPNYIGSDYGVEEFTGSKIPLAANILFYMRSLVGEMRNFLDRLMARLGTSDATAVADKIADAILPQDTPTEETDVEPTEVIEE